MGTHPLITSKLTRTFFSIQRVSKLTSFVLKCVILFIKTTKNKYSCLHEVFLCSKRRQLLQSARSGLEKQFLVNFSSIFEDFFLKFFIKQINRKRVKENRWKSKSKSWYVEFTPWQSAIWLLNGKRRARMFCRKLNLLKHLPIIDNFEAF